MSSDPRHHLGRLGEQLAAEHLERLGYAVVARNHRTRFGEIDLIACDGTTLVFCEVKTRRGRGDPWDALHEAKRAQVRRMAGAYLAETADRPRVPDLRFDAIGVVVDPRGRLTRLDHLEGAF
jgi:putative endonuclease